MNINDRRAPHGTRNHTKRITADVIIANLRDGCITPETAAADLDAIGIPFAAQCRLLMPYKKPR